MAEYEKTFVEIQPGEPPPKPNHTDEFYCHLEMVKKKGRRKKTDPIEWSATYIPWDDLNETELFALCFHGLARACKKEMARWWVLHRGLDREFLIKAVRGRVALRDLLPNPFHPGREALQIFMYSNWKYIWSQIQCNTCCWECSDAQVQECVLENYKNLLNEIERQKLGGDIE